MFQATAAHLREPLQCQYSWNGWTQHPVHPHSATTWAAGHVRLPTGSL